MGSLRGSCTMCGREVRVRRDGNTYRHRPDGRPMRVSDPVGDECQGTRVSPGTEHRGERDG